MDEVQKLEEFIDENFGSKSAFAKALGITPQNLNHHISTAKKRGGKFKYDFIIKLEHNGIIDFKIARNPAIEINTAKDEPDRWLKIIEAQQSIINFQQEQIKSLQEQLKPPLDVGKTGGRHA